MDNPSPLEGIFNIIGGLPQGHDKPIKHALYNTVALFLLFLSCATGWALYVILEPFIKPLMWALLVGSVLHPLKHSISNTFQQWFITLEATHTPVTIGLFLLPINIVNNLSEFIGTTLLRHVKLLVGISAMLPCLHVLYFYTPSLIGTLIWNVCSFIYKLLNWSLGISSTPLIIVLVIGYITFVYFLWTPERNTLFHYASLGLWIQISLYLAHLFGSFQIPVFLLLLSMYLSGFISEYLFIKADVGKANSSSESLADIESTVLETVDEKLVPELEQLDTTNVKSVKLIEPLKQVEGTGDNIESILKEKDPLSLELFEDLHKNDISRTKSELSNASLIITNQGIRVVQPPAVPSLPSFSKIYPKGRNKKLQRSLSQPHINTNKLKPPTGFLSFGRSPNVRASQQNFEDSSNYGSTFYLYSVLWACTGMIFWKNVMLLPLLPLPILFYTIKHIGLYLGLWQWVYHHVMKTLEFTYVWCCERSDAFVPIPIRCLHKLIHKINVLIKSFVKNSIDTVSSCVVILGLIVFLICGSIFIAVQIYAEAIMLIQITSNVINQTVVHNPELRQLLPPAWDDTVDSILDNAYQYGREGISKAVRGVMSDVDSAKSEKLELQVLELWDRFYQTWMNSHDAQGPKVTQEAVVNSWESFISDIKKSPEMFNLNGLMDFAKQNVGTLMSLSESVWSIVKGNISLILGSVGAFLSVILGGGTAVLNFILNMVVFLTTLFYLLNSSGDLYKPVEFMTNVSPSGSRLGHALEGAVNGVFTASFKMASFYGMWTWFIHNLFSVRMVYLPSAFATILAAIPFLGTYWACVPAVLDLWLAQDRGLQAILFACFQFLPVSIVDTIIYKEIKGGHPYLTGLAIAGGIFCLGVEGAIIGPILLCGLYVAIDLSSSIFRESPSEESPNLRLH